MGVTGVTDGTGLGYARTLKSVSIDTKSVNFVSIEGEMRKNLIHTHINVSKASRGRSVGRSACL